MEVGPAAIRHEPLAPAAAARVDASRAMGATTTSRAWGGGRWSAVYSIWTYFHRLLHLFGISAVDHEEVALLSAPLVRIHTSHHPHRVLAHVPDQSSPAEPLGLVPPSAATPAQTLFVLHFTPASDPADCARLATAYPTATSPRAWVAVDDRTGALSLTAAEPNAAVFELRAPAADGWRPRHAAEVAIVYPCAAGRYLARVPGAASTRVRMCKGEGENGRGELFCINAVATSPDEETAVCAQDAAAEGGPAPVDETMAEVLRRTTVLPVRLHSAAHGWFVASSPGADLAAARRKEPGWDAFTVEFDYETRMARVRDSRGMYLVLAPGLRSLKAGLTVEGHSGGRGTGDGGGGGRGGALEPLPRVKAKPRGAAQPPPSGGPSGATAAPSSATESEGAAAGAPVGDGDDSQEGSFAGALPRAERFVIEIAGDDDRVTLRSRKGFLSARRNGTVCLNQNTRPSRREEFYLRLALPSMMDQSKASLRLRHFAQGVREVDASIVIPASAAVAYGVLRDYDGFKRFIRDCSESELLRRVPEDGSLVVRMAQAHSFLVLTISMAMTLRVVEDDAARKVHMDLIHGLGIKTYKGLWHAGDLGDGRCRMRVRISSSPAVPAPNFLVDGVMTHAVTATLDQIRTECILRSTGRSEPAGEAVAT